MHTSDPRFSSRFPTCEPHVPGVTRAQVCYGWLPIASASSSSSFAFPRSPPPLGGPSHGTPWFPVFPPPESPVAPPRGPLHVPPLPGLACQVVRLPVGAAAFRRCRPFCTLSVCCRILTLIFFPSVLLVSIVCHCLQSAHDPAVQHTHVLAALAAATARVLHVRPLLCESCVIPS